MNLQNTRVLALLATILSMPFFEAEAKTPAYKATIEDRRFLRSPLAKALKTADAPPACAPVLAGLLAGLADAAPLLHSADENFVVAPPLLGAIGSQLSTPRFTAQRQLAFMVRQVMLKKRLPAGWMQTAKVLRPAYPQLNLSRLQLLANGFEPVDSIYFTPARLVERFKSEVRNAVDPAVDAALISFRNRYLDRLVAWQSLTLIDIQQTKEGFTATLRWQPPKKRFAIDIGQPQMPGRKKKKKKDFVLVIAKLAKNQPTPLGQLTRGRPVLARGRLFDMSSNAQKVEIRDAMLFVERDWSKMPGFSTPANTMQCPIAINAVRGVSPNQPGGFGRH